MVVPLTVVMALLTNFSRKVGAKISWSSPPAMTQINAHACQRAHRVLPNVLRVFPNVVDAASPENVSLSVVNSTNPLPFFPVRIVRLVGMN